MPHFCSKYGDLSGRRILLGSASPQRKDLLSLLGIPFRVIKSCVDESPINGEKIDPYLDRICLLKWKAIIQSGESPPLFFGQGGQELILVADTSVVIDGDVLGKPADRDEGFRFLTRIQNRSHEVKTRFLLGLANGHLLYAQTVSTRVTWRPMSEKQRRAYVLTGEGMNKAGGYAIQGKAYMYIARIEGSYSNVVGLPICELREALEKIGFYEP